MMLVAREPKTTQAPEPGIGTPNRDQSRTGDILLVEVAKLQSDGDHLKRDLTETRTDMKDIRDRMVRLEVRVDHLPSKGFIVGVLVIALTIIGGLLTVAPKLQGLAGTATPIMAPPRLP
jgi:hypothetical protein